MKLVKENINDYLPGPSEEEIEDRLKDANISNDTLMLKSVKHGYLKGVKKALKNGFDINIHNVTILREVISNGHLDVLKYLVSKGANPSKFKQAAYVAATKNYFDIVKYIFENNFEQSDDRNICLVKAVEVGNLDMVKYLVEEQNAKISYDKLRRAVYNKHVEIAKYLIENKDFGMYYLRSVLGSAMSNRLPNLASFVKNKIKEENKK